MIYDLVAPTAFGLEAVTAREITGLGFADVRTENGRVFFRGDETDVAKANLWLRTAARVRIVLTTFRAVTFEELFQGVKKFPWGDLLPEDACFPVEGRSVKSTLFSISDCQAITKKAIVEKMKLTYHRERFPETGDPYPLEVALLNDTVMITLDTTGAGLHKRGYRRLTGEAPLKETMAAALLDLTYWKPGRIFADPMCGSGTLPIEAALIAENRAPGLSRAFTAEKWSGFGPAFDLARQQARQAIVPCGEVLICGSDIDPKNVTLAQACAKAAGVDHAIRFSCADVKDFAPAEQYGFVVTNPPYGERLGERDEVEELYRTLGRIARKADTWSFYFISGHPEFEKFFGRKADKRRKLFNGRLPCQFYQYPGSKPPRPPKQED